jgi:hypothetical protein
MMKKQIISTKANNRRLNSASNLYTLGTVIERRFDKEAVEMFDNFIHPQSQSEALKWMIGTPSSYFSVYWDDPHGSFFALVTGLCENFDTEKRFNLALLKAYEELGIKADSMTIDEDWSFYGMLDFQEITDEYKSLVIEAMFRTGTIEGIEDLLHQLKELGEYDELEPQLIRFMEARIENLETEFSVFEPQCNLVMDLTRKTNPTKFKKVDVELVYTLVFRPNSFDKLVDERPDEFTQTNLNWRIDYFSDSSELNNVAQILLLKTWANKKTRQSLKKGLLGARRHYIDRVAKMAPIPLKKWMINKGLIHAKP